MATRIFWSPSSQDKNIGILPGYIEEIVCNKIVDVAIAAARRQGTYESMRNRPSENYHDHRIRSDAFGAAYHIAVHTNAGSSTAERTEVGCFRPEDPAQESTKLANFFADLIRKEFPGRTVTVVKYGFEELRSKATCIYFEWGFHSAPKDCQWILNNVETIGELMVRGIALWQGKPWIPPAYIPPQQPSVPAVPQPTKQLHLITVANTASDGTGRVVKLLGPEATLIKTVPGAKFPYGLSYSGSGKVDAWFPDGSFE